MEVTSIRLLAAAVLPYGNGRHVPHAPGDVIPIAKLAWAMVSRINAGDHLLSRILVVE
jgi:hypothetical protein